MASGKKKAAKIPSKGRLLDDIRKLNDVVLEFSGDGKARKFRGIVYNQRTGHILATDIGQKEVCCMDMHTDGTVVNSFKLHNSGSATNGIVVTDEGLILVSDYYSKNIKSYTEEGEFVSVFTSEVRGPNGLSVSPNGLVFVADSCSKTVIAFGKHGNKVYEFGNQTPERKLEPPNAFKWPFQVCVAPDGYTYVSDVQDNDIKVFDSDGLFVRKMGEEVLKGPSGITMCAEGYIVTSSLKADNNKVSFFTTNGRLRHSFSPLQNGGESRGVAVDDCGFLYVTDDVNKKIVKV